MANVHDLLGNDVHHSGSVRHSGSMLQSHASSIEEEALNVPATQADLQQYFFKLRDLLKEIKNELLTEHKRQLDLSTLRGAFGGPLNVASQEEKADLLAFTPGTEKVLESTVDQTSTSSFALPTPPTPVGPPFLHRISTRSNQSQFSRDRLFFEYGDRKQSRPWKEFNRGDRGLLNRTISKASSIDDGQKSGKTVPYSGVQYSSEASRAIEASHSSSQNQGLHSNNNNMAMAKTLSSAARRNPADKRPRFTSSEIQETTKITAKFTSENPPRESDESSFTFKSSVLNGDWSRFLKVMKRSVKHPGFEVGCGVVICLNACLVGIETEIQAQEGAAPPECDTIQHFLNAWYVCELILRVSVDRGKFFSGDDANWNIFDMILVVSAFVDLLLSNIQISGFGAARALRALRLFRIVRTLRIIRQFKLVREFRKMVCSMTSSLSTLFWSLTLVFGVMYSFALWFTQTAAYYRYEDDEMPDSITSNVDEFYVSLSRTVYSLFAAISGGYSWHVLVDPWIATGDYWTVFLFFAYISISVFGLLNIVTSIFVESAMLATKHFQDLLLDEKRKDLEMYTNHMERIFHVIDADGGGDINFSEMQKFLEEDDTELKQYLEALGITSSDVWVLFKLLDLDGSGSIDIHEFCQGCMRLKGEARSFDINCMMYESRAMLRYSAEFMEFVEDKLEQLETENAQWLLDLDRRFGVRLAALGSKLSAAAPKNVASPTSTEPRTPVTLSPRIDVLHGANKRGVSMPQRAFGKPIQPKIVDQCSTVDFSDM